MKIKLLIVVLFLSALSLCGCVKKQNADNSTGAQPYNQNINDTNYQNELREQSARADSISDADVHVGGRR